MPKRFSKVVNGLFRGGEPSVEDLLNLKKHFNIKKVISLDGEIAAKIHQAVIGLGMQHIIIPINGIDIEPIITLVSQDLKELLLKDGPTYLHCRAGKDRTGMVIAMFQCRYGKMTFEEAMNQAKNLGFGIGLHPGITQFYLRIVRQYDKLFGKDNSSNNDANNADIVDNMRPGDDWRGSVLDAADISSFAPFMDPTQPFIYNNNGYGYKDEQYPTRNNYDLEQVSPDPGRGSDIPLVGQFSGAPIPGSGPVEPNGAFGN